MAELLHKELSFKIVGIAFEVHNSLGSDLSEKDYANAFEEILKQEGIPYVRELYCPLKIRDKVIAKKYFDFLIDGKVVVELKSGNKQYREACKQLFDYLVVSKIDLGIIIRFNSNRVDFKRIVNKPS